MILYFDPFSGISGDMTLGALIDAGLKLEDLRAELGKLPLGDYTLSAKRVQRRKISATKFDVKVSGDQPSRDFATIRRLIEQSSLSERVKEQSVAIFSRLAEAEAKIHNVPLDGVHFHEVGAVDAIVDIVGAAVGFELLGVTDFYSAPVNVGRGMVRTEDGTFPVPPPAVAELLKGVPTYATEVGGELTTPTGAAILAAVVSRFGPQPLMRVRSVGYGAGSADLPDAPNLLRVFIGEKGEEAGPMGDSVAVIEANIDDMSPQLYGYFLERALELGALDVYFTPIQMKKNRPGTLLTVICPHSMLDELVGLIFAETTTIGVRYFAAYRRTLERTTVTVQTELGRIRVKVSRLGDKILNYAPEYEDCRKVAQARHLPLKEVYALVMQAFLQTKRYREPGE